MTTMLEHLAVDASAVLTNLDRQELLAAYKQQDDREGSIVVALMIIAIIVNVTRLVMDHCVDKETFTARARKPGFMDKLNVHRRVRQVFRQMDLQPEDLDGVWSEQIANEIVARGSSVEPETLATVWNEGRDV